MIQYNNKRINLDATKRIIVKFGDSSFCVKCTRILCRNYSRRACAQRRAHLGFSFFSLSAEIFSTSRTTTLCLFLVLFASLLEVSISCVRGIQWCWVLCIWRCGCGDIGGKRLWQKFWWWRRLSVVRLRLASHVWLNFLTLFSLFHFSVVLLLLVALSLCRRRCWYCYRHCLCLNRHRCYRCCCPCCLVESPSKCSSFLLYRMGYRLCWLFCFTAIKTAGPLRCAVERAACIVLPKAIIVPKPFAPLSPSGCYALRVDPQTWRILIQSLRCLGTGVNWHSSPELLVLAFGAPGDCLSQCPWTFVALQLIASAIQHCFCSWQLWILVLQA